jgi:hypothetical protein
MHDQKCKMRSTRDAFSLAVLKLEGGSYTVLPERKLVSQPIIQSQIDANVGMHKPVLVTLL